jgi:C4-dicarboxylate-specific signal transduction histidine kinase
MSTQNEMSKQTSGISLKGKISLVAAGAAVLLLIILLQLNTLGYNRHFEKQKNNAHVLTSSLDLHIARVDGISQRIARDTHITERLHRHPGLSQDEEYNRDLLHVLESVKLAVDANIVYVMNKDGLVIACTTYDGDKTLTGNRYPFRPYFIHAMEGNSMIYPALGVTTNRRGLYFSSPVTTPRGSGAIGVVVIKMGLEQVDKLLEEFPAAAGIMSPDGVIFASNKPDWLYKTALPIGSKRLTLLKQSQQFGNRNLDALDVVLDKRELKLQGAAYGVVTDTGAMPGWKVFTLEPLDGTYPVVLGLLALVVVGLFSYLVIFSLVENRKKGILEAEQIQARDKIEAQNRFLHTVMDSLAHPFYIIDVKDYSIVMANKAADFEMKEGQTKMYCYALTHHTDQPCGTDGSQHHLCPLDMVKKSKKPVILEHLHKTKEGKPRYHEIHAYPIFDQEGNLVRMVEYNLDITNRKRLESELIKGRQLESIGILAGGIAHDFNNMLSVIIGNIELVKDDIPSDNRHHTFLQHAENNAMKAADLSRKLITFSRGGWLERKKINIPLLINQVTQDMQGQSPFSISMEFPDDLIPVHADERQLTQVFINIFRNAREAAKSKDLPRVRIQAWNLDPNDEEVADKLQSSGIVDPKQRFVKTSITDYGKGIPGDIVAKVFDPYFTTKQAGDQKGMGLGLTLCYSIIKKHGGLISVQSELGTFTTVDILLPAFT